MLELVTTVMEVLAVVLIAAGAGVVAGVLIGGLLGAGVGLIVCGGLLGAASAVVAVRAAAA